MFRMHRKLQEMEENGLKIRVAIVGAGKMGRGLINQMSRIRGMKPVIICDEIVEKARDALLSTGLPEWKIFQTNRLSEAEAAIDRGDYVVTENSDLLYQARQIEGVVDCTGNPPFGADLAYKTIQAKKHMIMLNVECDAVVGPILNFYAKEQGVIYTGSAGDEPGAIMELADFALGVGFDLLAVGKGKNNPLNPYATEDDLREEALSKGLYPKILTSFVDGTNTMLELTCVSNALGFKPDVLGGHGVHTDIKNIMKDFSLKEQGGILNNYGIIDFAFGIAPGVFAIVSHDAKEVHDLMQYVSMGQGPNYVLYRPYHLTSLETPITIYDAIVEKEATIYPKEGQVTDTITVAKRDLKKGDLLEGIGGKDVFGQMICHAKQQEDDLLPIGLITKKTRLLENVKKDQLIRMDQVALEEDEMIIQLRREQDRLGL